MSTVRDCQIDGHVFELNTAGRYQCRYCGQIYGDDSVSIRHSNRLIISGRDFK